MGRINYKTMLMATLMLSQTVLASGSSFSHTVPNNTRLGKANHPKYKVKAKNPCEIAFVKLLNGSLPATAKGNPALNMWDERFLAENLLDDVLKVNDKAGRIAFIEDLIKLVHKDQIFADNLSSVVNMMLKEGMLDFKDINRLFLKRSFESTSFFYSHSSRELSAKVNVDLSKITFIDDLINRSELTKTLRKEYRNILMHSNRTTEELEFALQNGMKLHNSRKHMEQFKKYIEFLDPAKPGKVKRGLQSIESIYDFNFNHKWYTMEMLQNPSKQFMAQKSRLNVFEAERLDELEKTFKAQKKYPELYQELADLEEARKFPGKSKIKWDPKRAKELRRKINKARNNVDDVNLTKAQKDRIARHANGERQVYRKMLNGCNSGDSKRLESAKKKFVRFKLAVGLGATPIFYSLKNWDKRETDPYWLERLGYEWAIGLAFTVVGNKIVTNSNTSFMRKYLEGYAKFSALDGISAYGYDALFGEKSYIRYFQALYKGKSLKELPPNEVEQEFEKLRNSPTFEEDFAALVNYVEERSKETNTMNVINDLFDLNKYSSLDTDKITQEDLESEEAREAIMQMLAQRMYMENMGNWPIFQTGNPGLDRWSFYRVRNIIWDMKGLAVNLAIFQIMCRQPLGKIGSWGLILGLYFGDTMFSGDLTYGMRRDAINQ